MLVHKSCDLRDVDGRDAVAHKRRGIYFLGNTPVSFEIFNTPSGQGGVQIGIANDYSIGEGGGYIDSIECYDCGKTVESFPEIELYKFERILDNNAADYDLEEWFDESDAAPCAHCFNPKFACACGVAK